MQQAHVNMNINRWSLTKLTSLTVEQGDMVGWSPGRSLPKKSQTRKEDKACDSRQLWDYTTWKEKR